jgi:hypothetical protein
LIPREGKPEHRAIHLQLLRIDVPNFGPNLPDLRADLPASVTVTVEGQALVVHRDELDESIELPAAEIRRLRLTGWSYDFYRAAIELRDPYEVVDHFDIVVGSDDEYWIRALAKMCCEKLAILVDS